MKDNGGTAFPSSKEALHTPGMTLRDYFAAKALTGMLAANTPATNQTIANDAYDLADAMMYARAQGGEQG